MPSLTTPRSSTAVDPSLPSQLLQQRSFCAQRQDHSRSDGAQLLMQPALTGAAPALPALCRGLSHVPVPTVTLGGPLLQLAQQIRNRFASRGKFSSSKWSTHFLLLNTTEILCCFYVLTSMLIKPRSQSRRAATHLLYRSFCPAAGVLGEEKPCIRQIFIDVDFMS